MPRLSMPTLALPSASPLWLTRLPSGRRLLRLKVLLPVLLVATMGAAAWRFAVPHQPVAYVVPQNAQLEATYGVRFSQVDVVGDGGLVELAYTVLDSERAIAFQSDTLHPPILKSESRDASVTVSALMKQGHDLRPGQTYFIIYQNSSNAVRAGELATITYKGQSLAHVPVR